MVTAGNMQINDSSGFACYSHSDIILWRRLLFHLNLCCHVVHKVTVSRHWHLMLHGRIFTFSLLISSHCKRCTADTHWPNMHSVLSYKGKLYCWICSTFSYRFLLSENNKQQDQVIHNTHERGHKVFLNLELNNILGSRYLKGRILRRELLVCS